MAAVGDPVGQKLRERYPIANIVLNRFPDRLRLLDVNPMGLAGLNGDE